jgi:type IV fimbrial biogenesis protein FimT
MTVTISRNALPRGFTLVEMMTSIAVLAITLALAVPSLAGIVRTSKVRAAQAELISSLMLARSEASKRGVTVSVGASAPTSGSEFSAGWTVWIDANSDGVVDSSEIVIRRYPDISSGVVLGTTGNVTRVSFGPTGFLTPAATATFKVCARSDTTKGYTVALQPVGLADVNDQATCP